jgi:hypothetical protein
VTDIAFDAGLKSSIAWRAQAIDTAPELALYGPETSVRCPILSVPAARTESIIHGAPSPIVAVVIPARTTRREGVSCRYHLASSAFLSAASTGHCFAANSRLARSRMPELRHPK